MAYRSVYDMASSDEWMAAGAIAYGQGKFVVAAKAARRALDENSSASAWLLLGGALAKLGKVGGAHKALQHAVRQAPDSLAIAKDAAAVWLAMDQPSQAIDALEPLLKNHPTDGDGWRIWGQAIEMDQRLGSLERSLIERATAAPTNLSLQRRAGRALLIRGLEEAATFLERAVPGDAETTWNLAEALLLRDPTACVRWVEQNIDVDPLRASKLLVRAGALDAALRVARATAGLESWAARLELWSGSPERACESDEPAVRAAHALVMQQYRRVVQLLPAPSTAEELVLVGEALRHLGRQEEAIQALERSLHVSMSDYNLAANLNIALVRMNVLLDAEVKELMDMVRPMGLSGRSSTMFEEALRRLSGNRTGACTWLDRGVWRRLRHRPGARHAAAGVTSLLHLMPFDEVITRAGEASPTNHPLMMTYRAELLLWCGRYDDALRDCEAALAISPKVRWAYFGKASVHLCQAEPQLALETLNTSARMLAPLANTLGLRGEAHLRLGQPQVAMPFFERAVAAKPSRLSAVIGLALAQLQTGVDASGSIDEVRRQAPVFWKHAERDIEGENTGPRSVLEALLRMARGNRASGTLTYFRDCGTAHVVHR